MAQFRQLSSNPPSFSYPFHTAPGVRKDTSITLINDGNVSVPYSDFYNYISGWGWIHYGGMYGPEPSGTVPFPANTETIGFWVQGPAAEGLYEAYFEFSYYSGTEAKILRIPVALYNFTNFHLPQNLDIRTSCTRLAFNQSSEAGSNIDGKRFSYFAELPGIPGYLYDGFLILGNSATTLTYSTAVDLTGNGINFPTVSNPFGFLYAATASMVGDSTGSAIQRTAAGKGYNRDSTLQFDVTWYASKIPDSCNFFVGQFKITKGPKAGAVNNLTIAYYCDWDVPSDTGSNNYGGVDATKYMLYQRGSYPGGVANNTNRYAALGGAREGGKIVGGFVVDNNVYIYPESGWENDSLWNRMNILAQDSYNAGPYPDPLAGTGPADDLSMVLVLAKGQTVATTADTVFAGVVLAGQPVAGGTLAGVKTAMDLGYKFMCNRNLVPGAQQCQTCKCGDADNSGAWSISDAVYLINYIFAGGPAPAQTCLGDADGSKAISISDAVYLINYIFAGGPAPTGC